jgi:VWFA-related protein
MASISLILTLLLGFGFVQDAPPAWTDAPTTLRVTTRYVMLDALVANKKTGTLVGGLGAKDFQLTEDGAPQKITYFSHDQLPLSVVLLFDLTDTVRPVLKPLAAGAAEILNHLKPQDQIAVVVFSSHTEVLQKFTADRALAAAAIEKASGMKSEDGTFIHEDMYEAVDEALQSPVVDSRRVLVWLTDGTSNFENSLTQKTIGKGAPEHLHSKEEATEHLERSGAVVAALIDRSPATDALVTASYVNPFSFLAGARMGDIDKYAELTGGPVLKSGKQEIPVKLAALLDELRGRYTLGYKPSVAKPDGTFCKIELKLAPISDHANNKQLVVRTRRGYYR